jgi:hypothetical protein
MTDAEAMIQDCIKRASKLTDWEHDFIYTLSNLKNMTEKQYERLEKIWERVT